MNTGQCGSGRRRRSRKMKGGNFYGFTGALDGTTAGAGWGAVDNSLNYNSETGKPIPDPFSTKTGGKRKSKKHSKKNLYADVMGGKKGKKSRKVTRRRKMYGGVSQILPAKASAGFTGEGSRGLADYKDVGTGMPNGVVPLK